ncbi:GtrA family protein [Buchananella hordeovulneris]|nr:GtrA family protein [Buchananella hordeovulneris]RRD52689.1 GtrA family protein [Buchananella hordeovulneris]
MPYHEPVTVKEVKVGPFPVPPRYQGLAARLWEVGKFSIVGGIAFVVDVGLFNLLSQFAFSPFAGQSVRAKILSAAVATVVSWLLNRAWTFQAQKSKGARREFIEFGVINLIGIGIAASCLYISRYILGFTSTLADNISGNIIGLILGMVFRFLCYKYIVFAPAQDRA